MDKDKLLTEPFQVSGSQDGQLVVDCFNNPYILKTILEHCSNPELLELSLVNKMWSYEARSVIQRRGNLMALLGCDSSNPCQQEFEDFGADVNEMNVVPYSGVDMMIIAANHKDRSALDLTETFLARLPLKQLTVKIVEKRWYSKNCSALLVITKLLEDFSRVLEKLTLYIEEERFQFIQHIVRDASFPALKVLELRDTFDTSSEAYTSFMKALVSRAPNLQEFKVSGKINLMVNVLEGSKAVLMHQQRVLAPFDNISEEIVHALILRSVMLEYPDHEFNFQRFRRVARVLLQASCKALHFMSLDAVFAVPLMCYGICFQNTHNRLLMAIHNNQLELDEPRILNIVKDFDFTRIFPNVNYVEVICRRSVPEFSPDHLSAIIEEADAVLGEPLPDRAANIKDLYIDSCHFSDLTVPFFAQMFPNIDNLELATVGGHETPFASIWTHWVDLKKLDVYIYERIPPNARNLDGVFCGIFPEEVAELSQRDEEYLKRVHIVPVMPGLTCVRGLKTLSLNYRDRRREPFVDDGTFVFSKVAALIALARCPAIAVSLNISSYSNPPAMTYLKPYVTVKSDLLGEFDL